MDWGLRGSPAASRRLHTSWTSGLDTFAGLEEAMKLRQPRENCHSTCKILTAD